MRSTLVLAAMTMANAMILVDQTAVPLTLPSIMQEFGIGSAKAQWVLNASLLPLAGLLVLGGRLGDLLGRRRVFLTGAVLFASASALGGLAPAFPLLLAARVAQGEEGHRTVRGGGQKREGRLDRGLGALGVAELERRLGAPLERRRRSVGRIVPVEQPARALGGRERLVRTMEREEHPGQLAEELRLGVAVADLPRQVQPLLHPAERRLHPAGQRQLQL